MLPPILKPSPGFGGHLQGGDRMRDRICTPINPDLFSKGDFTDAVGAGVAGDDNSRVNVT